MSNVHSYVLSLHSFSHVIWLGEMLQITFIMPEAAIITKIYKTTCFNLPVNLFWCYIQTHQSLSSVVKLLTGLCTYRFSKCTFHRHFNIFEFNWVEVVFSAGISDILNMHINASCIMDHLSYEVNYCTLKGGHSWQVLVYHEKQNYNPSVLVNPYTWRC